MPLLISSFRILISPQQTCSLFVLWCMSYSRPSAFFCCCPWLRHLHLLGLSTTPCSHSPMLKTRNLPRLHSCYRLRPETTLPPGLPLFMAMERVVNTVLSTPIGPRCNRLQQLDQQLLLHQQGQIQRCDWVFYKCCDADFLYSANLSRKYLSSHRGQKCGNA